MFCSEDIAWYYTPFTSYVTDDKDSKKNIVIDDKTIDVPQFNHVLYSDSKIKSQYFSFAVPIIESFGYSRTNLFRAKANLLYKNETFPDDHYNLTHVDSPDGFVSVLYYVNDSDGDTFFFDDTMNIIKRVTPKAGAVVIFDSNILHASSPPRKTETRVVINFVLRKNDETN